jgi:glycosyltransferase involved in cell wall biosynthesis
LNYQKKYPKTISVYKNPKKGACSARNHAFERSTGDYIQYLDADDLLPEDKIEKQISLIKNTDEDITLTCSWSHFWNDVSEAKFNPLHIYKNYEKPYELIIDMIYHKEMITSHAWLISRNIINKSGGWNEELLINQDGEFFARIILKSPKILYSNDNMVLYRQNTGTSITRSKSTYAKASSELLSLKLITGNILAHLNNERSRAACATLLERYAFKYSELYDDLTNEALKLRYKFKEESFTNNYSFILRSLIRYLGFSNTLKIINTYRKTKKLIRE